MSIRGYWGDATIDWDFDRFREANIRQMTKAAKKFPDVHQACSLLGHLGHLGLQQ